MIAQYLFEVITQEKIYSSRAYAFYSCLQSLLEPEVADWLHEQGETPISQFLRYDRETEQVIWHVSLLGHDAVSVLSPVLEPLTALELNTGRVELRMLEKKVMTAAEFISDAQQKDSGSRTALQFITPTSFKHNGTYTVLPSEKLILQSLIGKWNTAFPYQPLDDEDAFLLILDRLRIVDYSLRTTRFPLKSVHIPGFTGRLVLYAPLPAPMMEIWNLLVHFSEYSGIGIKTALGMGGTLPADETAK